MKRYIKGESELFDEYMNTTLGVEFYDHVITLSISDDMDSILLSKDQLNQLIKILIEYQLQINKI